MTTKAALLLKEHPMELIYPNIVPENNLRLPDALTIKYGRPVCWRNSCSRAIRPHDSAAFDCGCATISTGQPNM